MRIQSEAIDVLNYLHIPYYEKLVYCESPGVSINITPVQESTKPVKDMKKIKYAAGEQLCIIVRVRFRP
jgi:hypothetical protein